MKRTAKSIKNRLSDDTPAVAKDESAKAQEQLVQVKHVLADAVSRITTSFVTLREQSDAQRQMIQDLMSTMEREGESAGGRRHLTARSFAQETGVVLQQFTEMLQAVSRESAKTVSRIDEMAEQFDGIFKLVEQVNDISEATFVLAVNASVQAANAKGTAGQTFAVIATNVRDLSKKTQRFNSEIGEQITKVRGTIREARKSMAEMATRNLKAAVDSRQRVHAMLDEVTQYESFTKETLERANDAAVKIRGAASQAVTAMQFEDIVGQILTNVRDRIERVAQIAHGEASTPAAPGVMRDPVHQTTVQPGKVEFF